MPLPGADTHVVEIRVHGVMGTKPEALVGSVAAVDVAGDGVGRIVRPADRLLRPSPGPVLPTNGPAVARTVEGYVWGGMTSGGLAKSTWALLFPFSLANVAHWMLPPVREGDGRTARVSAAFGLVNRALLRLAALLLTALFIGQFAMVSLDLIAAQCLARGTCLTGTVPQWLRDWHGVRPAIGLFPVLSVIFVLHRVSTVSWDVAVPKPRDAKAIDPEWMPGANLVADPDTPALRALHTVASLAVVALLPLGGPFSQDTSGFPIALWWLALGLLVLAMFGVLALDDPAEAAPLRAGRLLRSALGPVTRRVLIGLGVALVLAAGVAQHPLRADLSGADSTVEGVAGLLVVVCVVFAVTLIPSALLARPLWSAQPPELRPWAGGWMAAPVVAVAGLLGGGFGAGFAIAVREFVGSDGLHLPRGYESITLLWGLSAVLLAVAGLFGVTRVLWGLGPAKGSEAARHHLRRRVGLCPPVPRLLQHRCEDEDTSAAGAAWIDARLRRLRTHQALLGLAAVLCGGAAVAIGKRLRDVGPPAWSGPLSTVGVVALGALAAGLLRIIYVAVTTPDTARHVGVLADLACFWPRETHPTVPPCYALKVVPELAARAIEHLRDPGTRVVLVGHSHGSLLVVAAAARVLAALPKEDHERLGVVTAGSQLQWAYQRAFPAVVPHSSLTELSGRLGGRWRALCRGTDPLGGSVTTWRHQVFDGKLLGLGFRADGTDGPLPPAIRSPYGALVLGGDHWLPDPRPEPLTGRRWAAGVLAHQDYACDPEWDRAVAMAVGLDPADPTDLPDLTLPSPNETKS